MKRSWWIVLSIFVLSGLWVTRAARAENFQVIETWQGYRIIWDAPPGARARVEIPAFCLEFHKEAPKEGTPYKPGKEKESPTLAGIFKIYRILKGNYSLRREFLLQDDFFSFMLKKATLVFQLREGEKVRQEMEKNPETSEAYLFLIRSAEELLSPRVLRVAVQQAIWCEREGITVYDLQKRVSMEGRDFNPDLQALVNLSLLATAPYTQLILEAAGSEKLWIRPEDRLKLKEEADPLADERILHNELEKALEVLGESETEDRLKKAYVWLELGNSRKAWDYADFELEEDELERLAELKYLRLYLEDRKKFDLLYQTSMRSIESGELQEAKTELRKALEALPHNSDARYLLGLVHYTLGNRPEALRLWKEVTEETPLFLSLNFEARLARLACLREEGRSQEMKEEYKELEDHL